MQERGEREGEGREGERDGARGVLLLAGGFVGGLHCGGERHGAVLWVEEVEAVVVEAVVEAVVLSGRGSCEVVLSGWAPRPS